MIKQPFTVAGIAAKQKELHALSAAALQPELDALSANFPKWISTHFELGRGQIDFIGGVDSAMIYSLIPDFITSLKNKIEIEVTLPDEDTPPLGSKFMAKPGCLKYRYDSKSGLQVTGQLSIVLGYTG